MLLYQYYYIDIYFSKWLCDMQQRVLHRDGAAAVERHQHTFGRRRVSSCSADRGALRAFRDSRLMMWSVWKDFLLFRLSSHVNTGAELCGFVCVFVVVFLLLLFLPWRILPPSGRNWKQPGTACFCFCNAFVPGRPLCADLSTLCMCARGMFHGWIAPLH